MKTPTTWKELRETGKPFVVTLNNGTDLTYYPIGTTEVYLLEKNKTFLIGSTGSTRWVDETLCVMSFDYFEPEEDVTIPVSETNDDVCKCPTLLAGHHSGCLFLNTGTE